MQVSYRQYPHPVLSHFSDDLLNCKFQSTVRCAETKTAYKFSAIFKTSSMELNRLLKERLAYFGCHVECPTTRFRTLFKSFEEELSFEIPSDKLEGKVHICSFVLAAEDLSQYSNTDFHPDYENVSFKVNKGDILAVAKDRVFVAEKVVDALRSLPSIFTFAPNPNTDAPPMDVVIDDPYKIVIRLSNENFKLFRLLSDNQGLNKTFSSLFVIPALVAILELCKSEDNVSEFEEHRWYRVLRQKLKDHGVEPGDESTFMESTTVVLAQKLIGNPLSGTLEDIRNYEFADLEEIQ